MINARLVSKSRQLTKGGSMPASRQRSYETPASARSEASASSSAAPKRKPAPASRLNDRLPPADTSGPRENVLWESQPAFGGLSFDRAKQPGVAQSARTLAATITSRFPLWKRVLDLSLVFLTIWLWLPVMLLVAGLIKLVSPGPVFYRQSRIGFRGRRFMIYKFRSMRVNAETATHEHYLGKLMRSEAPMTKLDATDSRLILFGRLLRAAGLDELPQIFNVIQGEMSLVGPRPCTEGEFEQYLPWQTARVSAPPGMTGYWQVNGKNKTTFNQMMRMDLYYACKMSLGLDLLIICKTLPAVLEQTVDSCVRKYFSKGEPASGKLSPVAAPSRSAGPA